MAALPQTCLPAAERRAQSWLVCLVVSTVNHGRSFNHCSMLESCRAATSMHILCEPDNQKWAVRTILGLNACSQSEKQKLRFPVLALLLF